MKKLSLALVALAVPVVSFAQQTATFDITSAVGQAQTDLTTNAPKLLALAGVMAAFAIVWRLVKSAKRA